MHEKACEYWLRHRPLISDNHYVVIIIACNSMLKSAAVTNLHNIQFLRRYQTWDYFEIDTNLLILVAYISLKKGYNFM